MLVISTIKLKTSTTLLKQHFCKYLLAKFNLKSSKSFSETITKNAYKAGEEEIKILFRNGAIESVSNISDIIDFNVFGQPEKKYMLVYPKEIAVINGF